MSPEQQLSPAEGLGLGLAFVATGLYFILVAFGLLPPPDEAAARGPAVLVFCAGVAFVTAGIVVAVRAKAVADHRNGDLAADLPLWSHPSYRVAGIATAGSLAAIGTWIAIGSGPRSFMVAGPFLEMRTMGEAIGRTLFGLGAVVVWIYVIALTVGTVRKLLDRRGG
jgi:hypothetical protein